MKRKLAEDKAYVFDKRLRYNVRQNETNCRFRDIVVRKEEGFTHVLLSSQTSENNTLTPEVGDTTHTHTHTHTLTPEVGDTHTHTHTHTHTDPRGRTLARDRVRVKAWNRVRK